MSQPGTPNNLAQSVVQLEQIFKSFYYPTLECDPEQALQQLEEITATMQSKLTRFADTWELDIEPEIPQLLLKGTDLDTRTAESAAKGASELWTSELLHRHVNMLRISIKNEGRMFADAFFYRVKAMLQDPDKSMIGAPMGRFLKVPSLWLKDNLPLFVTEAKRNDDLILEDFVPQAVSEMYAYSNVLQREIVRGAVTDGRQWIFVIFKRNEGTGGRYWISDRVCLRTNLLGEISKESCDILAGTLTHWVEHSDQDLDNDDWFTYT